MTDQELQIELEKLAGRKCKPEGELHVCWLIEQKIFHPHSDDKAYSIWQAYKQIIGGDISASWQQRAVAILAVKGMK